MYYTISLSLFTQLKWHTVSVTVAYYKYTHSLFNSHFYSNDISEIGCQHREDKTHVSEEHDREELSDAVSQAAYNGIG